MIAVEATGSLHHAWVAELERRFAGSLRLFAPAETQAARTGLGSRRTKTDDRDCAALFTLARQGLGRPPEGATIAAMLGAVRHRRALVGVRKDIQSNTARHGHRSALYLRPMTLPGYETIDHFGVTVPDLDVAVEFFVQALGAELWYREGPFEDPDGDSMRGEMRIHPRSIERLAMLRVASTATIELLEFRRDGNTDRDAPSLTAHSVAHIGLRVSNIDKALEHLHAVEDVEVLSGPTTVETGVAAGLRWVFFLTPWGLLMELIEFPPGMSV